MNDAPPPFGWPVGDAFMRGFDPEKMEKWWQLLLKNGTDSFFLMRDDLIIFERYAPGWSREKPHFTASLAKALTGGMSLILAINDGLIRFDDPAYLYIPQWEKDLVKSRITIRHLATHTSGVSDSSVEGIAHTEEPGWKGEFWKRSPVPNDPFTLSRDMAPILFEPGTRYQYSNPGIAMLGYAVTKALQKSAWKDIRTLLKERLMDPMGIPASEWSCGYGQTFEVDGLHLAPTWGGGEYSVRASAAIVRLMMRKGAWEKEQLIKANVVEDALQNASFLPRPGGHVWWLNTEIKGKRMFKGFPADAFWGYGARFQTAIGIPSLNLILIRNGEQPPKLPRYEDVMEPMIAKPLADSLRVLKAPYPKSRKIISVEWEPVCRVKRLASGGILRDGSDCWQCTWADDDAIYTDYGDGYGFAPYTPNKLGIGFAKIEGGPDNFVASNIRSDAENTGYGESGRKPSGLLFVDKVLYLFSRNDTPDGCGIRIGWSLDRARTFTFCDWSFDELGYASFVNFGKAYKGSRDNFVYFISNNVPSAYHSSDYFILARVPRDKIRRREAYEFFVKCKGRTPAWSSDIADRGPAFKFPGKCRRVSMSYNAGIGRYLLWQKARVGTMTGEGDPRFTGGFGVYEAPEPWGPWRTVFFTPQWDIGPGECGCFPTKWMSRDGKTMHLVCSGDDNFTVRKVTLQVSR